jgi:Icc-related predicted phosphoesterase
MKYSITAISDTHNKHKQLNGKLPGGDILIHSGDISSLGRKHEVQSFVEWFNGINNYTHKIFIAGNHDMSFDREILLRNKLAHFEGRNINDYDTSCSEGKPAWLEELLGIHLHPNVYYLENTSVEIEGLNIWGSPYSPTFGYGWGFNVNRGYDAAQIWNQIPLDTDIVITHSPIYGYNDRTSNTNENVGCADLYHRLHEVKPHLHFSGHIHEGYGWGTIPYKDEWGDIYTFNGSTCNLRYEAIQDPIKFNYDFVSREIEFLM